MDSISSVKQPPEFVSGGYFVLCPVPRPAGLSEMLPANLLTLSDCFCESAPNWVALGYGKPWSEQEDEIARRFGIPRTCLEEMTVFMNEDWQPLAFPKLQRAQEFRRRFTSAAQVLVIGTGLHRDCVDAVHAQKEQEVNRGYGLLEYVERVATLAPGGTCLGYEPLCFDGMSFHTWFCNYSPEEIEADLHIHPNEVGLFDTFDEAARIADHARKTGGEPGIWLPWQLIRYDRERTE